MTSHDSIAERLSFLAEDFTRHWPVPGGIITAVSRGKILFERPFGLANLDARQPVGGNHLFEIGSISKGFVGLMALKLAAAGKLDLDAPITTYLPWFRIATAYPMFTARHLMQHTSGLVAGADALTDELGQGWWMRDLPTGSAPGAVFHYSNIGYVLLGLLVSKLAGMEATEFCRTEILAPLGMNDTVPCIVNADRPRFAVGYAPAADDRPWTPGDALAPATWFETNGADGNIAATGGDMGRFLRMLLAGGEGVVGRESFQEFITSLAPGGEPIVGFLADTGVTESRYGLGINIETIRGATCLTHGGGMVGYATFILADRDNDVGISVLTNANGDCPLAQILARIGHAWLTGHEIAVPSPDLSLITVEEGMTGRFMCADRQIVIAAHDGGLVLTSNEVTGRLYRGWTPRFTIDHPDFRLFHLTFEGGCWVHGGRIFARQAMKPIALPAHLSGAPGHYRSHSPWFTNFRIIGRGDRLFLVAPGGVEAPSEDVELVELSPGIFRLGSTDDLPERLVLGPEIDGRVVTVERDGNRYSRCFTP
ncbi:MAG: serine hydrolase domain-containing protein [Pseudomonadota bacterium]